MEQSREGGDERYAAVRQYSLAQILAVWAAAAVPMGLLAWVAAPLLRDQLGGDEPLAQAVHSWPQCRARLLSGESARPGNPS